MHLSSSDDSLEHLCATPSSQDVDFSYRHTPMSIDEAVPIATNTGSHGNRHLYSGYWNAAAMFLGVRVRSHWKMWPLS